MPFVYTRKKSITRVREQLAQICSLLLCKIKNGKNTPWNNHGVFVPFEEILSGAQLYKSYIFCKKLPHIWNFPGKQLANYEREQI